MLIVWLVGRVAVEVQSSVLSARRFSRVFTYGVPRTPFSALALLLLLAAGSAPAQTPAVVPVDGEPFAARLAEVDSKWQMRFETGKETRSLAAADLVSWGACAEPSRGPLLVLADGGLMVADVTSADKESLLAESEILGTMKLPLETLAGIVFQPPPGRPERDALLDRLAHAGGESDRLLLDNGDEVPGLIEAIQDGKVRIKAEVGPLEVEDRRIVAIVFNPALRRKPAAAGLRAWVGLRDGSRVLAAGLTASSAVDITSDLGPAWKTTSKEVVFLQPLAGRAVYLSDLKAAEYRHLPYFELSWPCRADRNVADGMLRCGGRLYLKGIGVHSTARLTYELDQPYKRFRAELGIDDSTGGRGSVGFRVFVDGKPKFSSNPVRGGAAPLPISIDVSGAKRLDLVVDYGERGDELDHANWLDARLIK